MSIYASTSNSYWNERQKKQEKKSPLLVASVIVFAIAIGVVLHDRHSAKGRRAPARRRSIDQTNESHWKQCESMVNSRQECMSVCQPERNSMQREMMHQACLQGCQQTHVSSTALACRGKVSSEEEVFQEIGDLAYVHCSKFQATDPRPDVFAKCRKYHRAGVKGGFHMGVDTMNKVLDEELAEIMSAEQKFFASDTPPLVPRNSRNL